ncbi:MAG: hypothetical protein Q3971_02080 [Moraxella sp.]|nr:hypothetical protein [Moraxella sp.]
MLKQTVIALFAVFVLGASGCGFALRGTQDGLHVAPAYQNVQLVLDDTPDAFALKQSLIKQLQMRGINPHQGNSTISIHNVRFRQYKLVGTLTEIRLVLMADVEYQLGDQKHAHPLQAERSHQYNEASVTTTDKQGDKAKIWLYDSLSEQIAEQYRAIAQRTS